MRKWKCHKVVEAEKITALEPDKTGGFNQQQAMYAEYILRLGVAEQVRVTQAWLAKHPVLVGGYFVRYADGYESYSPAKAFEEGYTQLVEIDETLFLDLTNEPILRYFAWSHLPAHLQKVSKPFAEMAMNVILQQTRSAERTVALRKLLECKDATVRAALPQPTRESER